MNKITFSIAQRLYAIVGLIFLGIAGLAAMQVSNLSTALREQRQGELKHLTDVALSIAQQEYESARRENLPDATAKQRAAGRIGSLRYGQGDYFWINDMQPAMVMHPTRPELNGKDLSENKDPNGKKLFIEFVEVVRKQNSGFVDYQWPKPGSSEPQPKLSHVVGFAPWQWVIGTGVYIDDLQNQLWVSLRNAIVAALIILLIVGTITLLVARRTSKALVNMTRALTRLGDGDFEIALPGLERGDELGDMARSIDQFRVKASEKAKEEARQDEERRQISERAKAKALQEMAEGVELATKTAVGDVATGTDRMASNASLMTDTALMLEKNSGSVAAAAEEALANAQTVARASSQLAQSISQIATQVGSSRAMTLEAVAASAQAQTTIAKLSDAATKVGAVTNLINEIASQTNLLALNATIEAARAGTAGRGFAVVASEVKSLAAQTAKATNEIALQITEIQDATKNSVASINSIGDVIRNVESVSSAISAAIEEQNVVTAEISRTVEETSHAAREVASQIASVSAEASETGRRAAEIRDGSAEIARKVDDLRATLVKVIRTSTTDVDRRSNARVDMNAPGTITAASGSFRVTVRDISQGGVLIAGLPSSVALGNHVALRVDNIPIDLSGTVMRADRDATLVKLALNENADQSLGKWLATRTVARAA